MDVKTLLENHLNMIPTGAFLFVGSGLSRRYLDLETWSDLLRRFCIGKREFEFYLSTADGQLPKAATALSKDFHKLWWTEPQFAASREIYKTKVTKNSHALKTEIAQYIRRLNCEIPETSPNAEEIRLLRKANIDGIITTNWDVLLEGLFPDFKTYIGQDALLFSSPASIAEIYKIHGCCTEPSSLVLTTADYQNFNKKNPYLAAKLLTLFTEHPVIFLGYSLSDPNITAILASLVRCLGQAHVEKLQDRLIFVEWSPKSAEPSFVKTFIKLDEFQVPITAIKTSSFIPVYESLLTKKRKLPLRILRYCKEQIYELVKGNDPKDQLVVMDIENTVDNSEVEFVVGVGVAAAVTSQRGYRMITVEEIIEDVLFHNKSYSADDLLKVTAPILLRNSRYIPLFKYLKQLGILSGPAYKASDLRLDKAVELKVDSLRSGSSRKRAAAVKKLNFTDVSSDTANLGHTAHDILLLDRDKINPDELLKFLKDNYSAFRERPEFRTDLRKLAYYYDRLANGWI
jgi:SIR2-like domain